MPASKWRRFRERWRREMFLRGSPSYRVSVWTAGLAGGLFWIWVVEKDMPVEERRVFLPSKREIRMKEDEILRWNAKYSSKKAQDLLPVPQQFSHTDKGGVMNVLEHRSNDDCSPARGGGFVVTEAINCPVTVDQLREKLKAEIEQEEAPKDGPQIKKKESFLGNLRIWTC